MGFFSQRVELFRHNLFKPLKTSVRMEECNFYEISENCYDHISQNFQIVKKLVSEGKIEEASTKWLSKLLKLNYYTLAPYISESYMGLEFNTNVRMFSDAISSRNKSNLESSLKSLESTIIRRSYILKNNF